MLILYLLITSCVLYWYWKTRRKSGEPPILSGAIPLIGHAYMIAGGTVKLWERFKSLTHECMRNGHAMYFLIGSQKFYVLTDPDDIYLVSNCCVQKDTFFGELSKELLGGGLVFADGKYCSLRFNNTHGGNTYIWYDFLGDGDYLQVHTWRRHRKLILPTFNQQILDSFLTTFNSQARELVKKFANKCQKGPFDHTVLLRQNAFDTISLTAMGVTIEKEESLKYIHAYDLALDNGLERYQKFWYHFNNIYNKSNLKKQQDYCVQTIREMAETVWNLKRQKYKEDRRSNIYKSEMKPFLEHLLENNSNISDEEIKDEINTMLVAGSDTSSSVLIFALILIGSFPNVQEKIYSEFLDVFENINGDVEKDDLTKLVYLEAVLKETMRYYVMAPFIVRYIDRKIELKNCTLQPGNNCFLSFYGVHRHPIWRDAEKFRPERWFDTLPSNPNIYVPFSIGKRNCIGRSYAMMSMKTTLCHLLRRFKVQADKTQLKIKLDVVIKPASGYFISVENR